MALLSLPFAPKRDMVNATLGWSGLTDFLIHSGSVGQPTDGLTGYLYPNEGAVLEAKDSGGGLSAVIAGGALLRSNSAGAYLDCSNEL